MNKRLIKYVLKGVIALGTAGFLNGISIKILEDVHASKNINVASNKSIVTKNTLSTIPGIDLSNLSMLPNMQVPGDNTTNILIDQGMCKPMPEAALDVPTQDLLEEGIDGKEPTETAKNQLVIGALPTSLATPGKADSSEKHRENYRLPRIYTAHSGQNDGTNRDSKCAQEKDLITLSENDWSTKYENDRSYGSNSARRSAHSDDEMMKQFARLMEQENRSSGSNQSCAGSAPQNIGTGSSYKSPNNSYTNTTSGSSKSSNTPSKNTNNTETANKAGENLANGFLPFTDEDEDEKAEKKLKKKNKKEAQKVKKLGIEQKKLAPIDTKKIGTTPVVSQPDSKKPIESTAKDNENMPAMPAALTDIHQKFDQAIKDIEDAKKQKKTVDQTVFCNLINELINSATKWITENKKNTIDAAVQKELKKYKLWLEQRCTGYDAQLAEIQKQALSEEEKAAQCADPTVLKSIYQGILNAYNDNAENNIVSPEVEKKPESEKGFFEKFEEDHPIIAKGLKYTGVLATLGIAGLCLRNKSQA